MVHCMHKLQQLTAHATSLWPACADAPSHKAHPGYQPSLGQSASMNVPHAAVAGDTFHQGTLPVVTLGYSAPNTLPQAQLPGDCGICNAPGST